MAEKPAFFKNRRLIRKYKKLIKRISKLIVPDNSFADNALVAENEKIEEQAQCDGQGEDQDEYQYEGVKIVDIADWLN